MTEVSYSLRRVYFYISGDCNLRCRHCWISPRPRTKDDPRFLDVELFRDILSQAREMGVTGVKLTGGEPLLHPDVTGMLEAIRAAGLGVVMETNGVLCTRPLVATLAGCKAPKVAVSLDGADAETHDWIRGTEGCFERTLRGIRLLVDAGVAPQIISTVFKHNVGQLQQIIRLAASLGAESVKFNVLQPVSRGRELFAMDAQLSARELMDVGRFVNGTLRSSSPIPVGFDHPPAFEPLGRIFSRARTACGTCGVQGIIGVLSDGSYAVCGIGESVPELILGDARRVTLRDVWRSSPILREIRQGLPHRLEGTCGDCLLKARCLGHCIAQNYYSQRRFWAPFWYCQQARDAGLFPASRLRQPLSQPTPTKGESP